MHEDLYWYQPNIWHRGGGGEATAPCLNYGCMLKQTDRRGSSYSTRDATFMCLLLSSTATICTGQYVKWFERNFYLQPTIGCVNFRVWFLQVRYGTASLGVCRNGLVCSYAVYNQSRQLLSLAILLARSMVVIWLVFLSPPLRCWEKLAATKVLCPFFCSLMQFSLFKQDAPGTNTI